MVSLKDFDLFGTQFNFNFSGNDKIKSKFGAVCSILYFISFSIVGLVICVDFFDYTNFLITYTFKSNVVAKNYTLTNENFFFALSIISINGEKQIMIIY